ncbi:MAG: hypothetical protein Q9182_000148 [Xanthomendoza sp. 2 TL-2023]
MVTPCLTRPPTPPKENVEEAAAKLPIDHSYQGTLGQHILLDTPNESPSSSSDSYANSGGKSQKRVIFSPWHSYHNHLDLTSLLEARIRPLPPSKECIALHKSILKASAEKNSPQLSLSQQLVLDPNQGIATMMESVTQRLTEASRDSRLDTYKNLIGCLSAYENLPETPILVSNLSGFLDFLRQDIMAKQSGTANLDVELATTSLKILSTMLYTPVLVDAMPDEFCTFIAEQAVSSIERQDIPKVMVDHYMQLLGRQKLPQRVLNYDRANRLLTAINGLELRLKGNRVIGLKLMIYQRLLLQTKTLMMSRTEQWLEFLIASVSSSIKDIRTRAIAFGNDAALALGTTSAVSQACLDVLSREHPSGSKVIDHLGVRMVELLKDQDGAIQVPQIWIIFLLFLRSRYRQIERWEHLTGWLGVMQQSFNYSDVKVKRQANIAWNRFVSAISLDTSTSLSMIKVLRQPITAQLERKSSDRSPKHAKQIARSSYCNLLYFAFRPGVPHEQLDLYWDNFVTPLLLPRVSPTTSDQAFACQVLTALLSSLQPKLWDQNRAHQLSLMKAEELPCLDPKWVRLRAAKILHMLEQLLAHSDGSLPESSPFFGAWQSFMRALGDAASKEIKVSMETMAAFANITSMLNHYWHQNGDTAEMVLRRLECYTAMINEAEAKVGFRPFTEKRLLLDSSGSTFEAAETPSGRSSYPRRILNSPVIYMLDFLVKAPRGMEASSTYKKAIHALLAIALRAATGRRSRLAIIRQLGTDVLSGPSVALPSRLILWTCLAKETKCTLSLTQTAIPNSETPQYPGQDYRQSMALLETGIREFGIELYPAWTELSDAVLTDIEAHIGEAGISLVYTEPLACVILESFKGNSDACLGYGAYLVRHARWPGSRQDLERAQKQLWGPSPSLPRDTSPNPFDLIYSMVEHLLLLTYASLQPASQTAVLELITSINFFLESCPLSMKAVCLEKLQKGLAVWIEDSDAIVSRSSDLQSNVKTLCKTVLASLKVVPKPDSFCLSRLQDLITSGFQSRHKRVVNEWITAWNQTFGRAETLEYPVTLRIVLKKLRPTVDIELPGFVEEEESEVSIEVSSSPFHFVESQGEEDDCLMHEIAAAKSKPFLKQGRVINQTKKGASPARRTVVRSPGTPRTTGSRRQPKLKPKARLRHDNSQIEFAAVDSSPLVSEFAETQHLTDHQKEIKERQEHGVAAMFRDIRSSARSSRSADRPVELVLHKKQSTSKPLDADAEPSPTFPPGDVIMNEFLGSSPTPCSSSKDYVENPMNRNPGSSPPFSPLLERRGSTSLAKPTLGQVGNLTATPSEHVIQQAALSSPATTAPSGDMDVSDKEIGYLHGSPARQIVEKSEAVKNSEQRTSETEDHLSDLDVFIDAPVGPAVKKVVEDHKDSAHPPIVDAQDPVNRTVQEPTTSGSATASGPEAAHVPHTGSSDVSRVEESFYGPNTSTPTEDELIREQLLRDLEEASSQAESQLPERRSSVSAPSKVTKKRKTAWNNSTEPRKKAKLPPSSSHKIEVVVETRRSDPDSDDYIIVDERPATGTKPPTSPLIKLERSPSPVRTAQSAPVKTPNFGMASARRRTRSMAADSTLQSRFEVANDPNAELEAEVEAELETDGDHPKLNTSEQHSRKRRRGEESQYMEAVDEGPSRQIKAPRRWNSERKPELPSGKFSAGNLTNSPADEEEEEEDLISSQLEGIKHVLLSGSDTHPEASKAGSEQNIPSSGGGDTIAPRDNVQQPRQPDASASTPARSLLTRLKALLHDFRQATLWPAEEKEMMGVALEVVGSIHEAGFRSGRRGGQ